MRSNPHNNQQSHIGNSSVWDYYLTMEAEHNEITLIKRNQSKVVRPLALSSRQTQPEQQPHNYMILANSIFYNGQSADRIYLNGAKIWEKTVTPPTPTYGSKTFAGKFIDDTTESDWVFWPNGQTGKNGTSIKDYVDPETKEFEYEYDGKLNSCNYLLDSNAYLSHTGKFHRIDHIPDTSGVTDMSNMFYNNVYLKSVNVSDLDTSNVVSMNGMFKGCETLTSLDVSNFDTSNVTDMSKMFNACHALTSLDVSNFDTSNVTNMNGMFNACHALTSLDVSNFDTSNVTDITMFVAGCFELTTLNISGWSFDNLSPDYYFFQMDDKLTTVLGPISGIHSTIHLHWCPLTNASAMVFINGLVELETEKSIYFSRTTYDALTPEQIAVATNKGWNVVRSSN